MLAVAQVLQSPDDLKPFFDNREKWLRPQQVSSLLGIPVKTIYDWKHRPQRCKAPAGLFIKFNGRLFVRTDILRTWIFKQNG